NLESASAIHATSAIETEELRRFGFRLPPIYEVPNGIEARRGPHAPLSSPLDDLLSGERPVVLSLGRVSWKKGLDRLIAAMTLVPHCTLLIVGNDDEGYAPKLRDLAVRQ